LWDILRRHLRLKQIDNGSRFSQKTVQKAFMKKQRDIELVSKTVTLQMLMFLQETLYGKHYVKRG